jgi:hypothetical protein
MDVRPAFREWLESEYCKEPNSLIVEELGLCQGSVRADFAVVNGILKGFEIKSERDTLSRLHKQIPGYSQVFDTVSIATAERHLKEARKSVPRWWGICIIRGAGASAADIEVVRAEKPNPAIDAKSLVQLLWKDEVVSILSKRFPQPKLTTKARRFLWAELVEALSLHELRAVTRTTLKLRQNWRVDQGRMQDGAMFQPSAMSSGFLVRHSDSRRRRYTHRPS